MIMDNSPIKKLSINSEVPITVYKNYAYPLSVICTYPEAENWINNHFVNVYLTYQSNGYIWYDFLEKQLFLDDIVDRKYMDMDELKNYQIIELIENTLLEEKYVTVYLDEFYIQGSKHYQKRNVISEFLFYGFDCEEKKFLGFNFNSKNVMGLIEYDYDGVINAHRSVVSSLKSGSPQKIWIKWEAFSSIKKKAYSLNTNVDALLDEIEDYNESKEKEDYLRKEIKLERGSKAIYGAATMKALVDALYLLLEEKRIIDYRYIHLIWEHKKLMLRRMTFLACGLNECNELVHKYEDIVNRAQVCKSLYLKGLNFVNRGEQSVRGYLQNEKIIHRIIEIMESIIIDEKPILKEFVELVRKEKLALEFT